MTTNQMRSAVMRQIALERWKNTNKKVRKAHASKMGKASAVARAKKAESIAK